MGELKMKETDLALLQRFTRAHDADAFSEIVGRYQSLVYSTCVRILGDPAGAEDARCGGSPIALHDRPY